MAFVRLSKAIAWISLVSNIMRCIEMYRAYKMVILIIAILNKSAILPISPSVSSLKHPGPKGADATA